MKFSGHSEAVENAARQSDNHDMKVRESQSFVSRLATALAYRLAGSETRAVIDLKLDQLFNLNRRPCLDVDVTADEPILDACWDHIQTVWTDLGSADPHWSVLTCEQYRADANPSDRMLASFHESGHGDVQYLVAFLDRAGLGANQFPIVAEYGCGVGRTTQWLASQFSQVRAVDISTTHLEHARTVLAGRHATNVEFHHLRTRDGLQCLDGVDLFFSLIVLQHNPPPVILDILGHAFRGLRPGGAACFQVPTYLSDYSFRAEDYLRTAPAKGLMELHCVPQREIFRLAHGCGMAVLEVRQDHCLGLDAANISNTFLMRKHG